MAKIPVIVGPTGSGKTGVAIEIARRARGEVISADSRAIYKYMDIGTAKPNKEEGAADGEQLLPHLVRLQNSKSKALKGVDFLNFSGILSQVGQEVVSHASPFSSVIHWGIDLVEPGERFTVADWKKYAEKKIFEIEERGHLPIVAGGTGLYIDALIFDYQFDVVEPVDRKEMDGRFKVYGIKWEMAELKERLRVRAEQMFNEKLYAETEFLVKKYGWGSQAMKSNIYQFAWEYMEGKCTREEAIMRNVYDDYHLAKRQMTWFKRNKEIIWLPLGQVKDVVLKTVLGGEIGN